MSAYRDSLATSQRYSQAHTRSHIYIYTHTYTLPEGFYTLWVKPAWLSTWCCPHYTGLTTIHLAHRVLKSLNGRPESLLVCCTTNSNISDQCFEPTCVHVYTPVGRTALVCINGIRIDFTLPLPSSFTLTLSLLTLLHPFLTHQSLSPTWLFYLKSIFPHFVIFLCIHLSPFARLSSYFLSFDFTLNIYCSDNSSFSLAVLPLFNLPSNLSL